MFLGIKINTLAILTTNEEVNMMECLRRKVRFCLLFVVLTAVVVGTIYYFTDRQKQSEITEGTLISSLCMELKQLCQ